MACLTLAFMRMAPERWPLQKDTLVDGARVVSQASLVVVLFLFSILFTVYINEFITLKQV